MFHPILRTPLSLTLSFSLSVSLQAYSLYLSVFLSSLSTLNLSISCSIHVCWSLLLLPLSSEVYLRGQRYRMCASYSCSHLHRPFLQPTSLVVTKPYTQAYEWDIYYTHSANSSLYMTYMKRIFRLTKVLVCASVFFYCVSMCPSLRPSLRLSLCSSVRSSFRLSVYPSVRKHDLKLFSDQLVLRTYSLVAVISREAHVGLLQLISMVRGRRSSSLRQ